MLEQGRRLNRGEKNAFLKEDQRLHLGIYEQNIAIGGEQEIANNCLFHSNTRLPTNSAGPLTSIFSSHFASGIKLHNTQSHLVPGKER